MRQSRSVCDVLSHRLSSYNGLYTGWKDHPLDLMSHQELLDMVNKAQALADELKRYKFLREMY